MNSSIENPSIHKSTPDRKNQLLCLKLGGALITDKASPSSPKTNIIARLAREIGDTRLKNPDILLILGHGSGSFGHFPAYKYQTRYGVKTSEDWQGFAEVWYQAFRLNRIVIKALKEAGLYPIAFPPSSGAFIGDGETLSWELTPMKNALKAGLTPVVYGDVVVDTKRGGTILSTEDVFRYLAYHFKPIRILIASVEPGVWERFPARNRIIPEITPNNFREVANSIQGSEATDVTGGMASKVREMLQLTKDIEGLEVFIFSGLTRGNIQKSLLGKKIKGTIIHSKNS